MESFSDGVFGFAATLLVADLALGHGSSALRQVLSAWPAFVAYVISFLTIGAAGSGAPGQSSPSCARASHSAAATSPGPPRWSPSA